MLKQREWDILTASREDIPSTSDLIMFLESRCRALELLQNTQSGKTVIASSRQPQTYEGKVSKPSYSNVVTQNQCTLCNGSHRLFKCDVSQITTSATPSSCQTTKIVLDLFAVI